jgi:exportin-2 (importin alpha re-exporter)
LHLAVAVAVRTQTAAGGVSQLNPGIDILEMFNQQIFPEVQDDDIHGRPIVKADALKFVSLFRSQMPAELMMQLLPHIIKYLNSTSVVVQTYAAYTIERFLSLKDTQPDRSVVPRLPPDAIASQLQPLFSGLFTVLENDELPENEYVMKAVMRTLLATGPAVVPVTGLVLEKLTLVLGRVAGNPRNPYFNHYIFESIGILIKSVCESNSNHVADFENALFPPFELVRFVVWL